MFIVREYDENYVADAKIQRKCYTATMLCTKATIYKTHIIIYIPLKKYKKLEANDGIYEKQLKYKFYKLITAKNYL